MVAELAGGDVIGLEIKASASPNAADARHLERLAEKLGSAFRAGAVLHTGPRPFPLGERIVALPICSMWTG